MKKTLLKITTVFCIVATMSSCATVFGGKITDYQRTRPAAGQPAREVRVGALIANVLLFPLGVGVDFLTGAAYKPSATK